MSRYPPTQGFYRGECSYAVLPQADGSSQIVLVEKSSLGVAATPTPQSDETVALECPHAVVMDNEYESNPWCVDITLMYADSPLPFANEGKLEAERQTTKENLNGNEQKLSQLLEQIDKGNVVAGSVWSDYQSRI